MITLEEVEERLQAMKEVGLTIEKNGQWYASKLLLKHSKNNKCPYCHEVVDGGVIVSHLKTTHAKKIRRKK